MANWKITISTIGKSSKCSWAMSCTYSYAKLPEGIDVYGVFPIKSSIYSGCSTLDPPFIQDSHVEWGDEHPYPLVICYSLRTWTWPSRNSWFTMIYLWKMMFFHRFCCMFRGSFSSISRRMTMCGTLGFLSPELSGAVGEPYVGFSGRQR